jgi:hypothetical protein
MLLKEVLKCVLFLTTVLLTVSLFAFVVGYHDGVKLKHAATVKKQAKVLSESKNRL